MRVSAVLLYKGKEFPLKTNRLSHKGELTDEQYSDLFCDIYQTFDRYMKKKEEQIICPNLSKIKTCLGKKRSQNVDFDFLDTLSGRRDDVIKTIIDYSYTELKKRQKEELEQFIGSLFMED